MSKNNKKPYPKEVCYSCGVAARNGKVSDLDTAVTYWSGECDICGEKKGVTSPRDFKYPTFEGFESPNLSPKEANKILDDLAQGWGSFL